MKIEMGEDLISSYLKYVKKCKIVQLNWKVYKKWDSKKCDSTKNELTTIFNEIQDHFGKPFGKSKFDQIIKTAEIDAIGFNDTGKKLYAVDIAFHINGLGYKDNVKTIIKKIMRTLFILELYFDNNYTKKVIFCTPKIQPKEYEKIEVEIENIQKLIKKKSIFKNSSIEVILGNSSYKTFENEILNKVLSVSKDIADTSQLFLRSYQLFNLFKKDQIKKDNKISNNSNDEHGIGKIVKETFKEFFEKKLLQESDIQNLTNKDFCKTTFNINYPVLKFYDQSIDDNEQKQINNYPRYYTDIYSNKYLLCKEWYLKNKKPFEKWKKSIK